MGTFSFVMINRKDPPMEIYTDGSHKCMYWFWEDIPWFLHGAKKNFGQHFPEYCQLAAYYCYQC